MKKFLKYSEHLTIHKAQFNVGMADNPTKSRHLNKGVLQAGYLVLRRFLGDNCVVYYTN